jgi:hypothetical protein
MNHFHHHHCDLGLKKADEFFLPLALGRPRKNVGEPSVDFQKKVRVFLFHNAVGDHLVQHAKDALSPLGVGGKLPALNSAILELFYNLHFFSPPRNRRQDHKARGLAKKRGLLKRKPRSSGRRESPSSRPPPALSFQAVSVACRRPPCRLFVCRRGNTASTPEFFTKKHLKKKKSSQYRTLFL